MNRSSRLPWLALTLALVVSVVTPASADSYLAWSEAGIPPASELFVWCETEPACDASTPITCDNPEGGAALQLQANAYIGWGVFLNQPEDLSAFDGGDMRFSLKAGPGVDNVKVEFECFENAGTTLETYTLFIGQTGDPYGFVKDNTWQEVSIPVCDFFPGGTCVQECIQNVRAPFMSTIDMLFFQTFFVDNVRWQKSNTHTGATPVQVQGRQLLVNGEPFVVNGVGYAPLSVGEDWTGAWRDRADRYDVDFPLMAAKGINTVRLYAPILSTALLDEAWANGLYVMPTFGVAPAQIGCPEGRQFMIDQFVETVTEWKDHPAILAWVIGNEVNRDPAYPFAGEWYPHLDAMAAAAQAAGSSHPVGTANADNNLDGICEPGISDDTTLSNVDFWAVQLYRGCSFGNAFAQYDLKSDCDRPLIVSEFGADAYDSVLDVEDQTLQADCLESLLDEADQALAARTPGGVLTGQVIFEWTDEWWKANPDASNPDNTCVDGATAWDTHDGCISFNNFSYTDDPGINEEWWGIIQNDALDPAVRTDRSSATRVSDAYSLGAVCNMDVVSYDTVSGNTSITFDPANGSADHTLYYGLLSNVSSYTYTGSVSGLGADGSTTATLPPGPDSLFWVVAGRNGPEGCYGKSTLAERPCSPSPGNCSVTQATVRTCECSVP